MWGRGFLLCRLWRDVSEYLQMSGEMRGGSLVVFEKEWSLISS